MPKFSRVSIIKAAKMSLIPADRKKNDEISLALSSAVEDMAMRLYGAGIVAYTTEEMAAGTRTVDLRGENDDLDHILFLNITTNTSSPLIDYKSRTYFLRKLNAPNTPAGIPEFYTVLTDDDDGYPTIKFNCPTSEAYTLEIYYFPEGSPENISRFKNPICLIHGTVAYFYGAETERGAAAYANFEKLVGIARAADKYPAHRTQKFAPSRAEEQFRDARNSFRRRRA